MKTIQKSTNPLPCTVRGGILKPARRNILHWEINFLQSELYKNFSLCNVLYLEPENIQRSNLFVINLGIYLGRKPPKVD